MARNLVDRQLERALVVSVPFFASLDTTAMKLVDMVAAEDFDDQEARVYWHGIEELTAEKGWFTVQHLLKRVERTQSQWDRVYEGERLVTRDELYRHAAAVAELAGARRARLIMQSGLQLIEAGDPTEDIVRLTQDRLLEVKSVVPEVPLPRTLADIKKDPPERRYNWAVPRFLEFKDRVMITGREGGGKMTLLRQLVLQFAAGFHPWDGTEFEPLICLQVDLQDGQVRNEREFDMISDRANVAPFEHLFVESRDSGINVVRSIADRRWLEGLIRTTRPHVVALGPIYQMCAGEDATDAVAMQALIDFINRMRTKYDIIWLLEAHAPKGESGGRGRQRTYEPFGSQRFMAWPDAGYGIMPDSRNAQRAKFKDWRGNRDMLSKIWPEKLAWGEVWPWVPMEVKARELRHRPKVPFIPQPSDDDAPPEQEEAPF